MKLIFTLGLTLFSLNTFADDGELFKGMASSVGGQITKIELVNVQQWTTFKTKKTFTGTKKYDFVNHEVSVYDIESNGGLCLTKFQAYKQNGVLAPLTKLSEVCN